MYSFREMVAVLLFELGVKPKQSRIIGTSERSYGYGHMNYVGYFDFPLPEKYHDKV